ncbi:ATP synthase F1 subunit gamma [Candidatus Roizmanbacteria bacterium RIFCSPLOWO2_01_FULL_37_12]|uniref:ATP synthase gamma chain n=1 Tax=Candidatus Roizmanbacteria bacterium RIFCSPLOWO2_01_FULL_37_12 TaxID=1802056 RepID=A0A1F7I923_9BACT|nr:MAG: ATP synthase F1 subunit gamma [Candidatus Roizmanbacteria bacterium RIFCSPHIGHO2_02_FULL_37_9b]OGK39867.1 MAG: ATP synthase F1 subunit gamma [Candidatus Roizmanbacteria bacterium RIFCSPLOWO2_01_FULL_37_12]
MNLRQVRKKTKSIKNVKKITKAMQLISAIKMKKAQQAEVDGRPYRDTLSAVIEKILPTVDPSSSPILGTTLQYVGNKSARKLVVLISSNKGLCGAFHVNIHRFLLQMQPDFNQADFITVGSKGIQFVSGMGGKVLADFSGGKFVNEVSAIFSFVFEKFFSGDYGSASLIYNKYISTFRSVPIEEILLPFRWTKKEIHEEALTSVYTLEPQAEDIIEPLLKSYLEERIRGAIISSEAVEHAQRMMAMKNATDNSTDIIYNLTLIGNKLRQEKITNELLDMITAKESVEN